MQKTRKGFLCNTSAILQSLLILFLIGCMPVFASPDSLTVSIENYFSGLKNDFLACSASAGVKSRHVKHIDAYFIKTLKKHQPLFSLVMTTSKGKVLSEVVRGEKPVHAKKDVARQIWYLQVSKSLKEYDGLMREDNGRYYLFWSVPILHKAPKGHKKFEGVVVAKIDLWDCFHKIAESMKEPFYIRLNDITLYTHLWENQRIFVEDTLVVPGAEKISVRHQKIGVTAVPVSPGAESASVLSRKETSQKIAAQIQEADKNGPKPAAPKVSKNNLPIVIGLIGLIIIITVVLIIQLIGKIKHLMLMRSIDKQDRR
jgi:hypothetical protein